MLEEFTSLKDEHYVSLKRVKDGLETIFNENFEVDDQMATHENLKDLI